MNKQQQAFPCLRRVGDGLDLTDGGMTLRDYFAAKAMQIMWDAYDKGYCDPDERGAPVFADMAKGAYSLADAMLRAREGK